MKTKDRELTALVLQGGGALGAYQSGVYEALESAALTPDWIAGISIGAIIRPGMPIWVRAIGCRLPAA